MKKLVLEKVVHPDLCSIKFCVDREGQLITEFDWEPGKEDIFAKILHSLTNGAYTEAILSFIQKNMNSEGRTEEYGIIQEAMSMLDKEPMIPPSYDEPLISPTEVF